MVKRLEPDLDDITWGGVQTAHLPSRFGGLAGTITMESKRWQQIERLCAEALRHPPQERGAFLAQAGQGDDALRREVESLLEKEADFLHEPALDMVARQLARESSHDPHSASQGRSGIRTGDTISHYRILESLGEGGMGVIYLARDTRLQRKVALKFLPAEDFRDPGVVERFHREARAASALDHPHICTIYDIDRHDGEPFIAMQALQGQTLQERMQGEPLELDEILQLVAQVADALEAAHSKGILHRDIKPSNILITERGDAKVLDFGLAKRTNREVETDLTQSGSTPGTLSYMSPEQVRGVGVDPRTDLFSLGVVLYEMLTGVHPFRKSVSADTAAAILTQTPTPISRYAENIPELLQHVVRKMLHKEPERRYQVMRDLCIDLEQLIEDSDKSVPAMPVPEKTAPTATTQSGLLRPWAVPAAVAVFLILATLVWSWTRMQPTQPPLESMGRGEKSVAVLPLENLSADPDNEYFSDGITETIIAQLSKIGALEVISKTSAMRYKDSDKSLSEVARELGVATILDGSVQRTGTNVRITAQLIDARTGRHLWAETYDRNLTEVFAIQSDVAERIAEALRAELSSDEIERVEKRPTDNFEAYNLYLQGRHLTRRDTPEANKTAREYFEQAIELDPQFALAHAGLARTLIFTDATAAIEAAQRSIQLDDGLAEPYIELAFLREYVHRDPLTAASDFEEAVKVDPGNSEAHRMYGFLLLRNGRLEEAQQRLTMARTLDPLAKETLGGLALVHLARGAIDELLRATAKHQELDPHSPFSRVLRAEGFLALGEYELADFWLNQALQLQPDMFQARAVQNRSLLLQGKTRQAAETGERLVADTEGRNFNTHAAIGLIRLGQMERARTYLEEVVQSRPYFLGGHSPQIRHSTLLAFSLRETDPERFQEMLTLSLQRDRKDSLVSGEEPGHPDWLFDIATVSAIRGEKEEAYRWLQRAIDRGWRWRDYATRDPLWADFHGDERFQRLMAAVKARVDVMRQRVGELEEELQLRP